MQTFLPDPDFRECARILDNKRLGKQRVEGLQILNTLQGKTSGWSKHPVVTMWRGYEHALIVYVQAMIDQWKSYNFQNSIILPTITGVVKMPEWLGDDRVHSSHRAALLAKMPDYYWMFDWKEEPKVDYFWPTRPFELFKIRGEKERDLQNHQA